MTALAAGAAVMAVAAACGGDGGSGGDGDNAEGGKLTVWFMNGELPDEMKQSLTDEFTAAHPGVELDFQQQEWADQPNSTIQALASNEAPDVVEFGNTFTASFAPGLMDLTDQAADLGQANWFPGMADSGVVDGKVLGVPYAGGARVVLYRKDLFTQAGIEDTPTTLDELKDAAQKLQDTLGADNPDFGAFYYPGLYWHCMLPFLWDAGGDIAVQDGDAWNNGLTSDESIQGLNTFKDLVSTYSKAPLDSNELEPAFQPDALEKGNTAMICDQSFQITPDNFPEHQDDIGTFALPGANGPAPQLAGGSNLGISATTDSPDLAVDLVKMWSGTKYEQMLAEQAGLLPNTSQLQDIGKDNPTLAAPLDAISNSRFVPVSDKWAAVETSGVLPNLVQAILSGDQSVEDAAQSFGDQIVQTLNG